MCFCPGSPAAREPPLLSRWKWLSSSLTIDGALDPGLLRSCRWRRRGGRPCSLCPAQQGGEVLVTPKCFRPRAGISLAQCPGLGWSQDVGWGRGRPPRKRLSSESGKLTWARSTALRPPLLSRVGPASESAVLTTSARPRPLRWVTGQQAAAPRARASPPTCAQVDVRFQPLWLDD